MAGLSGSIQGLNSNLDTTSIIDALLTFDKQNVTLLEYDQALKTNQISTYQAINTRLLAFQTQAAALGRAAAFSATKIDVSNEDYLLAVGGENAGIGSYSLAVTALAQNHQIASQGFSEAEAANLGTGTITITVGDGSARTITIDSTNNSLDGIRRAINDAKIGVTATVINDGSSSNAYRLMLSADKTGAKNKIVVNTSLSGTKTPNFTTSSFDQVEKLSFTGAATSTPRLGTTAAYSGNQNKTYTFTVAGNGTQTVGTGDITINWSDGTNSGSIIVSQADTEVELTGTGSDGLKLQFGAGTLVAGDTFRVQTFAPLLQRAQDAEITLGSSDGGGSPITVTSETNTVKDLIAGVTLNLKKISGDDKINITVARDTDGIIDAVDSFITKFNDVIGAIDQQFEFDPKATDKTGVLFGDGTLRMLQNSLRGKVTSRVSGLESRYNMLAAIGIRLGTTGKLAVVDRTKLETAITENIDDVRKLFAASGTSSNDKISFLAMGSKTKATDTGYDVEITQVAKKGYLRGAAIADPATTPLTIMSANKNLQLRVDGMVSENIALTEKTYATADELVNELQQKINADKKIGKMGIEVSYFENGANGYLILTSGTYGKSSKVDIMTGTGNSAYTALGLAAGQSFAGQDVSGKINGEDATGAGQILTGKEGNATTEGLKLLVNMETADLLGSAEAKVKLFRGVGSVMQDFADSIAKSGDGTLARRTKALENQIDDIKERITDMNERMELKRQRLLEKFLAMEETLGQLNSQSSYLAAQLNQIGQNFSQIASNNSKG